MTMTKSIAVAAVLTGLLVPATAVVGKPDTASATMQGRDGKSHGTVTLETTPNGTLLHARLVGLPEGTHAFHVHETGACTAPFKSAGGHYNPDGAKHGIESSAGPHAGDMPNIHVPSSGALEFEVFNTRLQLDDRLLDSDGATIVIHAGADDYSTDPAGAAGNRIACGVIEQ